MMGISLASLGPEARRQASAQILAQASAEPPKRAKYGNVKTVYRSIQGFERKYDSKLEASYAATLDEGIRDGSVLWWTPQPRFPLPGGVTYVADFVAVLADGGVRVIDAKGFDKQSSINKRKQTFALYGVEVEIVRRA